MLKIIQGTTNVIVNYSAAHYRDAEMLNNFAFKNLTTFEFDHQLKRFMPDKRYYTHNKDKKEYVFHSTYFEMLMDMILSSGSPHQLIKAPSYDVRKLTVEMNPKFTDKPHQTPAIDFLVNTPGPRRGLELQPGAGKTYSATKSAVMIGSTTMIVVSGLTDQWVESIGSFTNGSDKVYMIQGFPSLAKLLKSDFKPEFLVVSLETLRAYVKGDGDYAILPSYNKFVSYFGIGIKIVDEAHLNFHANVLIDLAANIPVNIYLTATFLTANKSLNKIFTTIYDPAMRYGSGAHDKYIKTFFYGYSSHIMEQKCMTAQGYSHAKYEDILLKKPAIFIDWYERILLPLIRVHYIMSEQRNAGKLLIFCTTLDFIAKVRNALKSEFPHKKIAWYTGEDERDVLDINDIIISTPKGCGTGTDIKNLRCVINTVSYQAITTAFQMPGRLRKIDGVELHYVDTVNLFVGAQVRHWQERSGVFKQISTEYKEYRIP